MRPLKQQSSLQARDLMRSQKLVGVGHRFGKVNVLAIMSSKIYPKKLEWTSNANQIKFNGRLAQIHLTILIELYCSFCTQIASSFFCETRYFCIPSNSHDPATRLVIGAGASIPTFHPIKGCINTSFGETISS